jgi:hypothetical protein
MERVSSHSPGGQLDAINQLVFRFRTQTTNRWVGVVITEDDPQSTRVSLYLDVGRPDQLPPLLGFVGDEPAEIGA